MNILMFSLCSLNFLAVKLLILKTFHKLRKTDLDLSWLNNLDWMKIIIFCWFKSPPLTSTQTPSPIIMESVDAKILWTNNKTRLTHPLKLRWLFFLFSVFYLKTYWLCLCFLEHSQTKHIFLEEKFFSSILIWKKKGTKKSWKNLSLNLLAINFLKSMHKELQRPFVG